MEVDVEDQRDATEEGSPASVALWMHMSGDVLEHVEQRRSHHGGVVNHEDPRRLPSSHRPSTPTDDAQQSLTFGLEGWALRYKLIFRRRLQTAPAVERLTPDSLCEMPSDGCEGHRTRGQGFAQLADEAESVRGLPGPGTSKDEQRAAPDGTGAVIGRFIILIARNIPEGLEEWGLGFCDRLRGTCCTARDVLDAGHDVLAARWAGYKMPLELVLARNDGFLAERT